MKKKFKKVPFEKRFLISCDLDGTLLNNKSLITNRSKKVIARLIEMGHIFCINTARPFNSASKFYYELGLKTPIVCHNGAFLFSPQESDFTSTNWCISHEIVKVLLTDKKINKFSTNALIDAEKCAYLFRKNDLPLKDLQKTIDDFGIFTTGDLRMLDGDIHKFNDTAFAILFYPKSEETIMDLLDVIKRKVPTVVTSIWKVAKVGTVIKVSSPFCNKGIALSLLSGYYGVPQTRCIAFGDGLDDASMLEFAANGFAMKNGTNEAQIRANYVTHYTNNDDGVARALNATLKLGFKFDK